MSTVDSALPAMVISPCIVHIAFSPHSVHLPGLPSHFAFLQLPVRLYPVIGSRSPYACCDYTRLVNIYQISTVPRSRCRAFNAVIVVRIFSYNCLARRLIHLKTSTTCFIPLYTLSCQHLPSLYCPSILLPRIRRRHNHPYVFLVAVHGHEPPPVLSTCCEYLLSLDPVAAISGRCNRPRFPASCIVAVPQLVDVRLAPSLCASTSDSAACNLK
uniref:Uncharacterized protein n=1 Tax=Mycena chlorophos TaxID=658473 RepID=A0ABQ0L244_MYCCL|nr:predicted protein [Mycena chlorophos]